MKTINKEQLLYHKVAHKPANKIVASIELHGLRSHIACEYKDLVPSSIRHLPVVWLSERCLPTSEEPVFAVKANSLDNNKLKHVTDKSLKWWIYQGGIPASCISRV